MSTGTDRYQSPLSERYASKEMVYFPDEIPVHGESCNCITETKELIVSSDGKPTSQMSRSRNWGGQMRTLIMMWQKSGKTGTS